MVTLRAVDLELLDILVDRAGKGTRTRADM